MQRILSAGVVVVRQFDDGWRVLLLRAYNYWDCPKGVVEPGEDPLTTAKREVLEEAGIVALDFRWGEGFIETQPYGGRGAKNKVARYYLAATTQQSITLAVNPALGRPEHQEFRWLAFDDALELVVPRLREVLRHARGRVAG